MQPNHPDEIREALASFYGRFPREVGWKFKTKERWGFTRNRYVRSADELVDRLSLVQYDFFTSVYSFRGEFEEGKMWDREKAVIDRLFFDFDSESLKEALKEAKKLVNHLDGNPLITFSGMKGFHVHVLIGETPVSPSTLKRFGTKVVETLKLRTCDPVVFEVARLSRTPFSVHSKSGLMCTPLNPERLLEMDADDVLRFVKEGRWDFPEGEEYRELGEAMLSLEVWELEVELARSAAAVEREIGIPGSWEGEGDWRKRRIEEYAETLRKYGKLTANPQIAARHALSDWVARHGNIGAVEHLARVHFILLLIEEGYTDEQIHEIFRHAKDYNPKITQYYIDYNRKRLQKENENR